MTSIALNRDNTVSAATTNSHNFPASDSSPSPSPFMDMSTSMSTEPSSITPATPEPQGGDESGDECETPKFYTPQPRSRASEAVPSPGGPFVPALHDEGEDEEEEEEEEARPLKRVSAHSCLVLLCEEAEEGPGGQSEMVGKRNAKCGDLVSMRQGAEEQDRQDKEEEVERQLVELDSAVMVHPKRVGSGITLRRALSVDTAGLTPAEAVEAASKSGLISFTARSRLDGKRRSLTLPEVEGAARPRTGTRAPVAPLSSILRA